MRIIILFFWFSGLPVNFCTGQHLIGIEKNKAVELIKNEMKGFSQDNSTRNEDFNYLRFVNASGTMTFFIFLDENDISRSTRMVCDYSEENFVRSDLDSKYRKKEENIWEYSIQGEIFAVQLEKKEWYFVVTVKKKVVGKSSHKKFLWWKRRSY